MAKPEAAVGGAVALSKSKTKHLLHNENLFKQKIQPNTTMNKWIQLFLGLILLLGGIYVWGLNFFSFGTAALNFLKGGLMWMVLLVGLILVVLGISNLRE